MKIHNITYRNSYTVTLATTISFVGLDKEQQVDLSLFKNFKDLKINKNIFIVPLQVGYYLKDERNGVWTSPVKAEYNPTSGILTLKGSSSGNYYGMATLEIYIIN